MVTVGPVTPILFAPITPFLLSLSLSFSLSIYLSSGGGARSPSVWPYPTIITPTALPSGSQIESAHHTNSVSQSTDSMSNGSATPPTGDHQQQRVSNSGGNTGATHQDTAKFVFPQTAIPISPGIFGGPTFFSACGTSGTTPMTPTLLTPAAFCEPYLRAQAPVYSPFTLHPPSIPSSLPKTPTLPPPSPHAIVGGALPTSATLVGSPFSKGNSFMEDFTKIGSISPFIMSPGPNLSPTRRSNGTTIFFPTTITANGEAKLTTFLNGVNVDHSHDKPVAMDDSPSTNSPITHVKMEHTVNGHHACCVSGET